MSVESRSTRKERFEARVRPYQYDVLARWRAVAGQEAEFLDQVEARLGGVPRFFRRNRFQTLIILILTCALCMAPLGLAAHLLALTADDARTLNIVAQFAASVLEAWTPDPLRFEASYFQILVYVMTAVLIAAIGWGVRGFRREVYYVDRRQRMKTERERLRLRAQEIFAEGKDAYGKLAERPDDADASLYDHAEARYRDVGEASTRLDAINEFTAALYSLIRRNVEIIALVFMLANIVTAVGASAAAMMVWDISPISAPGAVIAGFYAAVVGAWTFFGRKHSRFEPPDLASSDDLFEYGAGKVANVINDLDVARRSPGP